MKNKYLLSGFATAMMATALVSCSDSFLDEAPQTSISIETVKTSEAGAKAAVTGLVRQMQRQFDNLKNGNLNFSGETFVAHLYGDGLGPDNNVGEVTNYLRSGITPSNFRYANGWWPLWMYNYCYSIIGAANTIIANIEDEPSDSNEQWLLASALTMRAHCYTRLMQVHGPRWIDSNNGQDYVLVLRLEPGEPNDKPFSTCNEVYDVIYSDLNKAIEMFQKTGVQRGADLFYVNLDVARGIYARAALLKNDYTTAQQMAHAARQNYPIMTANNYLEGFSVTNPEWMWAPAMDPLGIYYWGFGNHYGCNGHYASNTWGYTDSMQRPLYNLISDTDVRGRLYFGPMCVKWEPELAAQYGITEADFDDVSLYSSNTYGISITGSGNTPAAKNLAMWNFMKAYGETFYSMRPADSEGIYISNSKGRPFGTHYKFQGLADGYTSCWPPYMRAAEMLLIEAEAAYQNGQSGTAVSCLEELMAQRDPEYKVPATSGQGLFDEIKLQRRIELWGEGFNWFDYKRWNDVIEYKTATANDIVNSGSYPTTVVATYQPDFMNGWRAAIPQSEFIYNKLADPSQVGQ